MRNGTRDRLLARLTELVESVQTTHPVRVAVDGPPAGGKTTLADELAAILRDRGRPVIRACVDDFLWPRARRYRQGVFTAEGCYHDSFDYDGLHRVLLEPLGPNGDLTYQHAVYDRTTDSTVSPPVRTADTDAVLLFDGVFLLRPELVHQWELRVLVTASFEQTLNRARARDLPRLGSIAEVDRYFHGRYRPAQQLYTSAVDPARHADIVVHNDEPHRPTWTERSR